MFLIKIFNLCVAVMFKFRRVREVLKEKKEKRVINNYKKNINQKLKTVPLNSFSSKLLNIYKKNPSYLGKEIGLIKFNKKVYDVTFGASKESFLLVTPLLKDLLKKGVDLSKSNFIHTHIINRKTRKNINPSFGDISSFKNLILNFKMRNFTISVLNKKHIEIGRVYLLFDLKKVDNFLKVYKEITLNKNSKTYENIVENGFSQEILNQMGFKVRFVGQNNYRFNNRKREFV